MKAAIGFFLLSVSSQFSVNVRAVAPCNQQIIDNLRSKCNCYRGGVPPNQASSGNLGTPIHITPGNLPDNTECVTSIQKDGEAHTTLYMQDGSNTSLAYTNIVDGDHIAETDANGVKYKLYVMTNEHGCYGYYRCIDCESNTSGDGKHMGVVALGCHVLQDQNALASAARAKQCLKDLGIEAHDIAPCNC